MRRDAQRKNGKTMARREVTMSDDKAIVSNDEVRTTTKNLNEIRTRSKYEMKTNPKST